MNQKDKQLLLRDLCARLPYGVKAKSQISHLKINTIDGYFVDGDGRKMFHFSEPDFWQTVDGFQYYLRPMSSMTEKERIEFERLSFVYDTSDGSMLFSKKGFDWLNAHHFDYRGLIKKGLAIAVTEENNPYKNNYYE